MPTISTETRLNVHYCHKCGIPFALEAYFESKRRENGDVFYCPNGHGAVFTHRQTMEEKLSEAQRLLTAEKCAKAQAMNDLTREREDRAREALKTKRRHASGKCPCCQRSFASLARHIKHMHPEYLKQERKLP